MSRLPIPGSDAGSWGAVLNDFLSQSLAATGELKDEVITSAKLDIATQAKLTKADTAYQKPGTGIPASDLTAAAQTSLGKADSAMQTAPVTSVNTRTGAVSNLAEILIPTALKTANYNAVVSDLVLTSTASNVLTVTLPTAPADKSVIGVKLVAQGTALTVTITVGSGDVFNYTAGPTTLLLSLLNQGVLLQYTLATHVWNIMADSLPIIDKVTFANAGAVIAVPPKSPSAIDSRVLARQTTPSNAGSVRLNTRNEIGSSPDAASILMDRDIQLGGRRNLWQYTEDIASNRYSVQTMVKTGATLNIDGITLSQLTSSNFYGGMRSQTGGLGINMFTLGHYYLTSYYALARNSTSLDQFAWMRYISTGSSYGHGAKLLPANTLTRIWDIKYAASTSSTQDIDDPKLGYSGTARDPYHLVQATTEGGALDVYVGGFQIEDLGAVAPRAGIAMIGDSTMAGSSGFKDLVNTNAREVSTYLGALLNVDVFNRAVGGEGLATMDARWATDITPLAGVAKYVVIQGGLNDMSTKTLAEMQASMNSMVAKAITDGFIPVIFTCTPSGGIAANPSQETQRLAFNAWIRGVFSNVIDIASVIQDPHDIKYLRRTPSWYGTDGVHYPQGAKRAIAEFAAAWPGWEFPRPSPYQKIAVNTWSSPGGNIYRDGNKIIGPRATGWTAPTGNTTRTTFDTTTVTTAQLAERLKALIDDLTSHGLIGS